MKKFNLLLIVLGMLAGALVCHAADSNAKKKKVLFYSQSFGFRHSSVTRPRSGELSHAEKVFKQIAGDEGLEVEVSQDANDLKGDGDFNRYDGIVFYTTGSPSINKDALMKWLRSGKAFVGIHCGTDTFCDWPEYTKMINGCFGGHGPSQEKVIIKVEDQKDPATKMLGAELEIADEIYHFRDGSFSRDNCHVLLSIDTDKTENLKAQKMEKGKDYPVSWHRMEGKGRVFYTSLGHREDVWTNPKYQQHLMGGLKWTLGLADGESSR